jgi:hypothetical protein
MSNQNERDSNITTEIFKKKLSSNLIDKKVQNILKMPIRTHFDDINLISQFNINNIDKEKSIKNKIKNILKDIDSGNNTDLFKNSNFFKKIENEKKIEHSNDLNRESFAQSNFKLFELDSSNNPSKNKIKNFIKSNTLNKNDYSSKITQTQTHTQVSNTKDLFSEVFNSMKKNETLNKISDKINKLNNNANNSKKSSSNKNLNTVDFSTSVDFTKLNLNDLKDIRDLRDKRDKLDLIDNSNNNENLNLIEKPKQSLDFNFKILESKINKIKSNNLKNSNSDIRRNLINSNFTSTLLDFQKNGRKSFIEGKMKNINLLTDFNREKEQENEFCILFF